jgi:hypothetical protein
VVEDLFNAGIRFVHMSEEDERRTKAFGYQLGLETDWNSCICLVQGLFLSTSTTPYPLPLTPFKNKG